MRWPIWHEHLPQCRMSTLEFRFCHFYGWNVPSPLSSLTWHYIPSSPSPCSWLTKSSIPDWHQTVVEPHSYVPCAATDGRAHNFLFVRPQNIWHWFRICTKTSPNKLYLCIFIDSSKQDHLTTGYEEENWFLYKDWTECFCNYCVVYFWTVFI